MKHYTQKDITQILGLKRTAVQQWLDRGFVAPSVESAAGHGSRNIWSRGDIFDLAIFKTLLEHGFSREEASAFIKEKEAVNRDGKRSGRLDTISDFELDGTTEIFAVQLTTPDGTKSFLLETFTGVFRGLNWLDCRVLGAKIVNITEIKKTVVAQL